MLFGGLLLSATVFAFAWWLHWNETNGWAHEDDAQDVDHDYLQRRGRSRRRVHAILVACSGLILLATIAGPGPVFVGSWTCVSFALMAVVGLAILDAFRTQRYHQNKLRKIRNQFSDLDET